MYAGRSLGQVAVGPLILEVLAVLRAHHLQLPRELALLVKMIIMTEGMGVALDPDFELSSVLRPYARRLVADRFSPPLMARRFTQAGADLLDIAAALPDQLQSLQRMMEAGGPQVHLRAAELEPLVGRLEAMGQRLVVAILTAAFVRGIGDLVAGDPVRRGQWRGPMLGAGLGTAGTMAAYLAWTGRKRRRRGT